MAKAKEIEGLDCAGEAGAGARLVLSARFEEMCAYREAALDWSDIEGVHDMRVASRRLRSAVRDFAPALRGGKRLDAAREALKKLADVLGDVRDLDVAIVALEGLKAEAPPGASGGVERVLGERHERREKARARLAREIDEGSLEEVRRLFARALEGDAPRRRGKKGGPGGPPSLAEMGDRIVLRLWDELRELSASLYKPLKTRRLHKMRIAAKRLRYAMELFAACRGQALKKLASEVADLQKALGDLHDCDVWVEEFGEYLSRRGEGGEDSHGERARASSWLLDYFTAERTKHYREALALWLKWEQEGFAARLDAALSGEAGEETSEPSADGAGAQPA